MRSLLNCSLTTCDLSVGHELLDQSVCRYNKCVTCDPQNNSVFKLFILTECIGLVLEPPCILGLYAAVVHACQYHMTGRQQYRNCRMLR